VRKPAPGTWTGVIFGDVYASGGTNGVVPWQVSTQHFVPFGGIFPSAFSLAPGQSQTLLVAAATPRTPGDSSGSIVLTSSGGGVDAFAGVESNSIAVTLRSLVDLANGGAFSGVLTGGNGRSPGEGQVNYYQFKVGPGAKSITANVVLSNDFADPVGAYLVAPDGAALGFGANNLIFNNIANGPALTASTLNPVPGTWTLIVDFAEPVAGDEISQAFSGTIRLNDTSAAAPGLPNTASTVLTSGVPVTVPVTITNTGAAPAYFFIDARLNTTANLTLTLQDPPSSNKGFVLPLKALPPYWLVPTETSSVQLGAAATLPIEFDFSPNSGDPDLFGAPTSSDSAAGSYTPGGGTVPATTWSASPDEIGPYAGPAPSGFVNAALTATTKLFDPAVTSTTGDFWLESVGSTASFAPVTLNPGQSTVVDVTITPSGAAGSVVAGTLYVDSYLPSVPPYATQTADELVALPYSYTIGAPPSTSMRAAGN
jgi:hypothetical protein